MSVPYFEVTRSVPVLGANSHRTTVAGVAFDNVTMERTVAEIHRMTLAGGVHHVCTGNLDHLYLLQTDEKFRRAYETASLVLADGMPVLWLSKLERRAIPLKERVAGSDLFWELAQLSHERGVTLFFLGGAPGSAEKAARKARERFPNVKVVGCHCPPREAFDAEAVQSEIRERVRAASPDILLVGFGAPKQEKWILEHRDALGVPVSVGVGGTFEMAGGAVKRAPRWVQRTGLEWAYRFAQDPMRLYKRYFCHDLPFLAKTALRMARAPAENMGDGRSRASRR